MIRLVITDDHKLVREAWALLLSRDKGISIVGMCENGREIIEFCQNQPPDVVLMDINMEPINGIDATRNIRQFNSDVKIIGISVHADLPYVNALVEAGANGYVTKNSSGSEMSLAIRKVMEGETYYCAEVEALNKV